MKKFAVLAAAMLAASTSISVAQDATVAAPKAGVANYDPTMSAKEAVLANWELAAAGIRAGRVVGSNVVEMAKGDAPYALVVRQANFAQKTMVQRYNAALWVYTADGGSDAVADASALTEAVAATNAQCEAADCKSERAALLAAFTRATEELDRAAVAARAELTEREEQADAVLMSEQLSLIADYLDEASWAEDFTLTQFGRDGEELAARIVGAMSLWRNIEPYVGVANQEIDKAINARSRNLLRTMRMNTRGVETLDVEGAEVAEIKQAAKELAVEFRRAAGLFAS
ncbi:MAG: hypothetical protein AAFP99_00220 [Pseudomonadota bacterium]